MVLEVPFLEKVMGSGIEMRRWFVVRFLALVEEIGCVNLNVVGELKK